jgi:two-component system response regulator HydG
MLYRMVRKSSSRLDMNSLQALERQAIRQALQTTGGDRVRAAKLLGIGKTTIYRKLKEYGLDVNSTEA